MADKYDMVVIGSGPGGYVTAIRAAQVGLKTAVVERDEVLGGRCGNVACIPAKAMLRAADVLGEARDGAEFGISVKGLDFDIKGAAAHRDKVVKTLNGGVAGLMKKNKIDVIEGVGSLTADGNVKVGDDEYQAKTCLLYTSPSPRDVEESRMPSSA